MIFDERRRLVEDRKYFGHWNVVEVRVEVAAAENFVTEKLGRFEDERRTRWMKAVVDKGSVAARSSPTIDAVLPSVVPTELGAAMVGDDAGQSAEDAPSWSGCPGQRERRTVPGSVPT